MTHEVNLIDLSLSLNKPSMLLVLLSIIDLPSFMFISVYSDKF